jgi:hypothetical protein
MKSAPRRAENAVAKFLTEKSELVGASPIERKPCTGRTGPDVSINELGLIVDVKSRGEVPNCIFYDELVTFGSYIAVPLDKFELLIDGEPREVPVKSKIVDGYFNHMDEWTTDHSPNGITCVILHKSGASGVMRGKAKMPYGKSMVIISTQSRRRLKEKWNKLQQLNSLSCNPATTPN